METHSKQSSETPAPLAYFQEPHWAVAGSLAGATVVLKTTRETIRMFGQ